MLRLRIVNKTRESVLGTRVRLADRWWMRVRGFLAHPAPRGGEGLLLSPCRAVHMIGLGYPLDVIFLDREGVVVKSYASLRPGRMTRFHRNAEYALELPAGMIAASGTERGDRVVWQPSDVETSPVASRLPNGATSSAGGGVS